MEESIIQCIETIKQKGQFQNYIDYIVFPHYKNLEEHTRINFDFPMTVLVGKNGSGKSSTLHALFGAPEGRTCSDFWFSTEVDPIKESGGRNRYYYGYHEDQGGEEKEVIKTRIRKDVDPDYWETSRPSVRDGMKSKKREKPVKKQVVYLDFRAEVSAFDKIFHFSKDDIKQRKKTLRDRSKYLHRLLNGEPMRFPGLPDEKVGQAENLSDELVKIISEVLGKQYDKITVADHKIFKNGGTSVYMQTKTVDGYSEANAGSGEIAVVQLVRAVAKADDYSLVLLDEPEVSIHPSAQRKLRDFLLNTIKTKKLQVVISTHSSEIVRGLPNSAIKLYETNSSGKFIIEENVPYQRAFYEIAEYTTDKITLYCEDECAQTLIQKVIDEENLKDAFFLTHLPGGEKTLNLIDLVSAALNSERHQDTFFYYDGDMKPNETFDEDNLNKKQINSNDYLKEKAQKIFGEKMPSRTDGNNRGDNGEQYKKQERENLLKYLRFFNQNVYFLPNGKIPEEILLASNYVDENYEEEKNALGVVDSSNAKKLMLKINEADHGKSHEYYTSTIDSIAYKWSLEKNADYIQIKNSLQEMLEKQTEK